MDTTQTIAKNTLFNFIATMSDAVTNFMVGIALARGLGTEQYGLYSLLMWFLGLGTLAVGMGLAEMSKRFIAVSTGQQDRDALRGIVRLTLMMKFVAAVVICLVMLVFSGFWAGLFGEPSNQIYFALVALILLPNALNLAFESTFSGFQKYEYRAYLILVTYTLRAALVIVLMVLGFGIREVLLVNVAVFSLGVFISLLLMRRLIPLKELWAPMKLKGDVIKSVLKYALTMTGISGINYILWRQTAVFFLGMYRPVEEVGFYNIASKIPSMGVGLIPMVLGMVLLPAISEQFGKGDMEKLRRIYITSARYLMMIALPLAAAGIALARPIIELLYGADYAPAVLIMQILFVPFMMRGIIQAAIAVLYGTNEPAFVFKVGLLMACLLIGLCLWLTPSYGMLGAAVGSSIPRLIVLPLAVRFASRKIRANWPIGDSLRIASAAVLLGLVLFGLQSQLSTVLSLSLSIPAGLAVYAAAILALRAIHPQDIVILKKIEKSLPLALRKHYALALRLVEKLIGIKPLRIAG